MDGFFLDLGLKQQKIGDHLPQNTKKFHFYLKLEYYLINLLPFINFVLHYVKNII